MAKAHRLPEKGVLPDLPMHLWGFEVVLVLAAVIFLPRAPAQILGPFVSEDPVIRFFSPSLLLTSGLILTHQDVRTWFLQFLFLYQMPGLAISKQRKTTTPDTPCEALCFCYHGFP